MIFVSSMPPSFGNESILKYSITNGTVLDIGKDDSIGGVSLEIEPEGSGTVTVHIPKSLNDFRMACLGYWVIVDRNEIHHKEVEQSTHPDSQYYLILTIPFQENSSKIKIAALYPTIFTECPKELRKAFNELPPKKQMKLFFDLSEIKCKDDFVLIFKKTDNSPACVKPTTLEKLIIREWTRI